MLRFYFSVVRNVESGLSCQYLQAVSAANVTSAFASNLENADYGNYTIVTDKQKDCIVDRGYEANLMRVSTQFSC